MNLSSAMAVGLGLEALALAVCRSTGPIAMLELIKLPDFVEPRAGPGHLGSFKMTLLLVLLAVDFLSLADALQLAGAADMGSDSVDESSRQGLMFLLPQFDGGF